MMATRIPTIGFALLLAVPAAHAGDYAYRDILGFSSDGKSFAFEEYGVQDGSGFPYANIFVVKSL
jgi:predicted secreted protein